MDRLLFGVLLFVWMLTFASIGAASLLFGPHSPNSNYTTDIMVLLAVNAICVLVFVYMVIQLYFKKSSN